ncbi:hypothetical protein Q7C36_012149 [Tachysurus vachellii]|uniref:Uncharacterized protein n=1 Tax=Tachysurus vachellii TaxID=175792 RepID=A0AA88SK19_TACVA|nr:uncharacterized protein si:ch211-170d8.2 [Tachysurus vachellii]KAK2840570.1 hypothetical protein Q7C36_012149 [Tachysurus vachellii]
MTPLLIIALGSLFTAVRSRSFLGAQCDLLTASWTDTKVTSVTGDWSHMYRLKVSPPPEDGPQRPVFPEQPLFGFIRRVYRCCQSGHRCAGVKGLQGRETAGSTVEFVLSEDVWSAPILRAEVHLHISNPHQLKVQPLLPWLDKRHRPTRYSTWWTDSTLEVRVDLHFLFQALQAVRGKRGGARAMEIPRVRGLHTLQTSEVRPTEAEGGDRRVEHHPQVPVDLGLTLHCSTVELNTPLPCESHGVRLLHTPFITLSYG